MEEQFFTKLISLCSYEFPMLFPFCLKVVCKCNWWCCCHFTMLWIVERSNDEMHLNDVFIIYFIFFVMLHSLSSLSSCNSIHFCLVKQSLEFKLSSPTLWFFIYNFFTFQWWHHGHFATLSIVASFINDLFQVSSNVLHVSLHSQFTCYFFYISCQIYFGIYTYTCMVCIYIFLIYINMMPC